MKNINDRDGKKLGSGFLFLTSFLICLTLLAVQYPTPKFDVQGHRGARGLMPENTIPAFLLAMDSGVTTIEMDLAITADQRVVVSHEPWMSAAYCLDPDGQRITEQQEKQFNIYKMTYETVAKWDCGSAGNARFPKQAKMKIHKPLLEEVMKAVEDHLRNVTKYEVDYNIEIKSEPEGDNLFHPSPEVFSDLVYQLIDQYLPWDRVVIQSFDFRVLKYWHQKYPNVRLSALVENKKSIQANLNALGFVPDIYSPEYTTLTKQSVEQLHALVPDRDKKAKKKGRLRVIPWTVNEEKEMLRLKQIGVDGIITDYPDRAKHAKLIEQKKK